jgi:hypothetical protein
MSAPWLSMNRHVNDLRGPPKQERESFYPRLALLLTRLSAPSRTLRVRCPLFDARKRCGG